MEVDLQLEPVNIFFGPNGAGKSTLLDAVWFVRDCVVRGVAEASSQRDHGIGLLCDQAPDGSPIRLRLYTELARYEIKLEFSAGRIEPMAGESLWSESRKQSFIRRNAGSSRASFYHEQLGQLADFDLREPEKLSLSRYLDYTQSAEAEHLDQVLRLTRSYQSRAFHLHRLRKEGSQGGYSTTLTFLADNLWSVLRNLDGRRKLDDRYDTIIRYMRRAFPATFEDLVIEPTGVSSLYGRFLEHNRREPINASGVSDGHLQLLILLTALFSDSRDRYGLLLLDEPETSLHPWALAVLAEAMNEAGSEWNKQILVATHSPVLISQFTPSQILSVEPVDGYSRIRRVSEIDQVQDLLDQYAAGSLYMAEVIGGQSRDDVAHGAPRRTEP